MASPLQETVLDDEQPLTPTELEEDEQHVAETTAASSVDLTGSAVSISSDEEMLPSARKKKLAKQTMILLVGNLMSFQHSQNVFMLARKLSVIYSTFNKLLRIALLPPDETSMPYELWQNIVNKSVLEKRPDSKPAFQEIFNNPKYLVFSCALKRVACDVTDHAEKEISRHLKYQPQQFKIGITSRPKLRFLGEGCYKSEGYKHMVLLAYGNGYAMGMLETHLIDKFLNRSGCMNIAKGGQGLNEFNDKFPFFVYVVLHTLEGQ